MTKDDVLLRVLLLLDVMLVYEFMLVYESMLMYRVRECSVDLGLATLATAESRSGSRA